MTPTNTRTLISTLLFAVAAGGCIGDGLGGGDTPSDDGGPGTEICTSVLAPRCTPAWYSDEECDPSNNYAECNWDGGDCCASTCTGTECGYYGFECRDPQAGGTGVPSPEAIGTPCAAVADPLAPEQLQAEVTLLSSDALGGRRPSSAGDLTTRYYLEERFRCLGLEPAVDGCYQQAFHSTDGDPTANIVGIIRGSDPQVADQIIVVGAHHDHLGTEDKQLRNGANDNVSGVVALVAIADQIKRQPVAPRRTIVFAAFGAEEMGLEGSAHFVASPPPGIEVDKIVYMVNLDMLGTYSVSQNISAYGTFADTPGRALLDQLLASHPQLNVTRAIAAENDSDYDAFCEAGIPYVYLETDDTCWHQACDDAERLDYPTFSEITGILHDVVVGLGNSETDLVMARQQLGCKKVSETMVRRAGAAGAAGCGTHRAPSLDGFTAGAPLKRRMLHVHP